MISSAPFASARVLVLSTIVAAVTLLAMLTVPTNVASSITLKVPVVIPVLISAVSVPSTPGWL